MEYDGIRFFKSRFIRGYSLMELSIVMSILAIVASSGLAVVGSRDEANRMRITQERMAVIESTIQGFVSNSTYGYLPCPADDTLAETSNNFGKPSAYDSSTGKCAISEGMLPVRNNGTTPAFNLSDEYLYDGWNRRFRYKIATYMGNEEDFDNDETRGDISVQDLKGHEKTNLTLKEPLNFGAAYVLISFGPNGYGGYTRQTNTIIPFPSSSYNKEVENSNGDNIFVQNDKTSKFDDVLLFKRKIDLKPPKLQYAKLVTPDTECHHAGTIAKYGKPGSGSFLDSLYATDPTLANQLYKSSVALKKVCDNPPITSFSTTITCLPSTFGTSETVNGITTNFTETRANNRTAKSQDNPSIAALHDGKYVVVWQSLDQDSDEYGIYGKIFKKTGAGFSASYSNVASDPNRGEFLINTNTQGGQVQPYVVATDYGFIVAWSTNFNGDKSYIAMQRYFKNGKAYGGEYRLDPSASQLSAEPYIVPFSDDSYILLFQGISVADGNADIYQQSYGRVGIAIGGYSKVNNNTTFMSSSQTRPVGAAFENDAGYVVLWENYDTSVTPHNYDIMARRYTLVGDSYTPQDTPEFQVNATSTNDQRNPDIARLSDNRFVVVWQSNNEIMAKLYDTGFVAVGGEFQVNTTTSGIQSFPSVTGMNDGGFIVAWSSENQDGNNYGIYHRRFKSDGTAEAGETLTNTTTSNSQYIPKIASYMRNTTKYMIAWQSYLQDADSWGIYEQIFMDGDSCP
ncbi:MAG: type II secretion system protein [Alphaproteobacteria bacterium]|nr:type II secretion system protein [Alphaproteobacteria bacterium]